MQSNSPLKWPERVASNALESALSTHLKYMYTTHTTHTCYKKLTKVLIQGSVNGRAGRGRPGRD